MNAGIRTPAEVIALALEDGGIPIETARILSKDAAKRLAIALRSVSNRETQTIIYSTKKDEIGWGTVAR